MNIIVPDPQYKNELTGLLESTREWGRTIIDYELRDAIEIFMDSLWELYLAYFQYHPDEARSCILDYRDLIDTWVDYINALYIEKQFRKIDFPGENENPWKRACNVYSRVIAFMNLFDEFATRINDEKLASYIEARRDRERLLKTAIPINTPESHWWWYQNYNIKIGDENDA